MKINSTIALIFSLALMLAPGANAQFGKLLGGDKDDDKKEETSSGSPFGALLGGGDEEEEPAFVLATAAEWLAKSEEDQAHISPRSERFIHKIPQSVALRLRN